MDRFLQVTAGVLLTAILILILNKQNREISLALTTIVCCMVLLVIGLFLDPVLDFVQRLQDLGDLDPQLTQVLLKAVGVGLIGEFASKVCVDSGNSALGKAIHLHFFCWAIINLQID